MNLSLAAPALARFVQAQLETFFPDGGSTTAVETHIGDCLERVDYCFGAVHDRYFKSNGVTLFNHLNSDHYSMFLYFLSNTMLRDSVDLDLCEKVFLLNKLLTGINVYPTTELPDIFLFVHALGTVLGRAKYSDYFLVYQNCTVGSNHETDYPSLGQYVSLHKGASILGRCDVGENCKIAADSTLMDRDLEPNSIYIGRRGNDLIKQNRHHSGVWDANRLALSDGHGEGISDDTDRTGKETGEVGASDD